MSCGWASRAWESRLSGLSRLNAVPGLPVAVLYRQVVRVFGRRAARLEFFVQDRDAGVGTKAALTQAEEFHQIGHTGQHGGDAAMRA